ncbi:MAG: pyridoxamine 5'-phosphate oxidase [Gemmatimonadota bacterium]|nr:pyridoxamine 5'-phosphate oxidase [Gemmatimonadota bacterium]
MSIKSAIKSVVTLGQGLIQGVTQGLPEATAGPDPIELFGVWFEQAKESGILLPESASLATASRDGVPSSRMVLLKSFALDGFVFFTNYGSRKAKEMDENPKASLLLHWVVLQRQVRVEGSVERISAEVSAEYFHTRARGSQIGAWASRQSEELEGRSVLKMRAEELEQRFKGRGVPSPGFWGGYRLIPERIEFWQGRLDRLHDRLEYTKAEGEGDWTARRLYP